jgi:hypothetical protein
MLEFDNGTPFPAAAVPGTDKNGRDFVTVVIKGTFALGARGEAPSPAGEQMLFLWADEHYGKPGESSVKYESDACPAKPGTDVVLVGQAYAPRGSKKSVDVTLRVGPLAQVVRVFGDRRWHRRFWSWKISAPRPFDTMPLVYERAFGGADVTHRNPAKHGYERRNPMGTGFAMSKSKARLKNLALPNLEDPRRPIRRWKDRPLPAGFGFVGRGWSPRVEFAGTYDAKWEEERAPLLPLDFDERYFNGAHPRLISGTHLEGGEPVEVRNVSREGTLRFDLPRKKLMATWCIGETWATADAALDTVVIEPDEHRLALTWRATIPCPRKLLFIDKIAVREVP